MRSFFFLSINNNTRETEKLFSPAITDHRVTTQTLEVNGDLKFYFVKKKKKTQVNHMFYEITSLNNKYRHKFKKK